MIGFLIAGVLLCVALAAAVVVGIILGAARGRMEGYRIARKDFDHNCVTYCQNNQVEPTDLPTTGLTDTPVIEEVESGPAPSNPALAIEVNETDE